MNTPAQNNDPLVPKIVAQDPALPPSLADPSSHAVEVPEVRHVVTGDNRVLSPEEERAELEREAAARRGNVVPPRQSDNLPQSNNGQPRKKKSAFRTSRDFVAGRFQWFDTVFYYKEMTDQVRQKFMDAMQELADRLGIDVDRLQTFDLAGADFSKCVDENGKPNFEKRWEDVCDIVIRESVTDWDDEDVPFEPGMATLAGFECKTQMLIQIAASTRIGASQSAFFQTASAR